MSDPIRSERRGTVLEVTIDRPKANAIDAPTSRIMGEVFAGFRDDPALRVAILTGAGEKFFCPGWDLKAAAAGETPDADYGIGGFGGLQELKGLNKPVIAAVNGIAAGAGMSTALAADLRVGSEFARFKTVFIERSLSPDSGLSYFLPRVVGYARAADLIFTSRTVDAQEAYRLGLLDRLVAHDQLLEEAIKLANEMTQWPPLALRMSKRVLQHNFEADIDDAMRYETVGLAMGRRATNDAKEAMLAFSEKRKPKYTGS
jgi:crotonobetainyl-CoA hydratase